MRFSLPGHERVKPDADLVRELYPTCVEIAVLDPDERFKLISDVLEKRRDQPHLRSSAIFIPGAVERLRSELSRLLWTKISLLELAKIISAGHSSAVDTLRKSLKRAAEGEPVRVTTVRAIAKQVGVDVSDFVILGLHTHPIGRISDRGRSTRKTGYEQSYGLPGKNPLANLVEQQRQAYLKALRRVQVPLDALQDNDARRKLVADLRDQLVVVELPAMEQHKQALADLLEPLRQPSARRRVTVSSVAKLIDAARQQGLFLRVARFIGVTERRLVKSKCKEPNPERELSDSTCQATDSKRKSSKSECQLSESARKAADLEEPTWSERHLRLVLASKDDLSSVKVDFEPFAAHLPTRREQILWDGGDEHDPGARMALSSIRADMSWCGHWEGRWLPIWPVPADLEIHRALGPEPFDCTRRRSRR